jgi:hypothetical protein
MATFNYFKAKEQGFSDEEIAAHLAEKEKGFNYQKAIDQGFSNKEIIGRLAYNIDPNASTALKAAGQGISQGWTEPLKGINQLEDSPTMVGKFFEPLFKVRNLLAEPVVKVAGGEMPTEQSKKEERAANIKDEFLYEMYKDQGYSAAAMPGYVLGTIGQPINWVGGIGGAGAKALQIAKEGAILGGWGGLTNPVYEEDTDGGRMKSAGMGVVTGFAFGLGFGKIAEKIASKFGKPTAEAIEKEAGATGKGMADEMSPKPTTAADQAMPTPAPSQAAPESIITPKETPDVAPVTSAVDPYTLKFDPKVMGTPKPRVGQYELQFESDLDKALYIIGNRKQLSKADDKFVSWVMENTGLSSGEVLSAAAKFKKLKNVEVREDGTAFVYRSDMPEFMPKAKTANIPTPTPATLNPNEVPQNQQLNVSVTNLDAPTSPFVGKMAGGFSELPKSWEALDNVSKNLYNIGRKLNEAESLGSKASIHPNEYASASRIMKEINPNGTQVEHGQMLKAYSDFIDELMKVKGDGYKPPTMPELFIHGVDDLTWQEMFSKGVFDGCNLL